MSSLLLIMAFMLPLQLSDQPFYPGGTYNPNIPSPEEELGYGIGERFTLYSTSRTTTRLLPRRRTGCR